MSVEQQQLEAAINALEAQRALLGDVVDIALAPLRAKLAALAPALAPEQSLKQVSVLFLDVVGSTKLAQHLDPEDIHAVMDGALARCTGIVAAHQGKVLQYAGDNLLAVFGADGAQEDDAERAVRCGLALLAEGRLLGDEVQRRHGHTGFDVRVGIHTGGVLLGGGVDAEGSIRGISVNIAARMEQTAPAGALRISHDTQRHVQGLFELASQAPIAIAGLDAPMASSLVLRERPRAFRAANRGLEGVATRMVGRDAELAQLQRTFKRMQREQRLVVAAIVAEAGVGKSRLLYEFERWVATQAQPVVTTSAQPALTFRARATPPSRHQPYAMLRELFAPWMGLADGDSLEVAQRKIERRIVPLFAADHSADAAQAHAHLLGHLLGVDFGASPHIAGIADDARQIRQRAFHAAAQALRRVAAQHAAPLLVLLDDLHWADDGSLAFIEQLVRADHDVPLLLLALTRPALFERGATLPADALRIDLAALDANASQRLADELLQRLPQIPAALRALVTSGAEGNPFYMEELVKMLVDEGAITIGAEGWAVDAEKLRTTRVPSTLTGVLQARLDALHPDDKRALQEASVIGVVFWDQALAAIEARATDSLPGVTQRQLVVPQAQAAGDGVREYTFKHQILHHVTYDTVLKRVRRTYHAKVAAWLASRSGARANDFLGATAEHFEKAGNVERACEFHARAAEHAQLRYAHQAVTEHAARALALLDGDTSVSALRQRWRVLDVRERTLNVQGRRAEQRADIAALDALADALDDDRARFEAGWRHCDIALRSADYRGLERAARQAIVIADRTGDPLLRLRAEQRLSIALGELGDWAAGEALAQQGLTQAGALGARRLETLFLNVLSVAAGMRDDPLLGIEIDQRKLAIDRDLGHRQNLAITHCNLGAGWFSVGAFDAAREHLGEGLTLTRETGDRSMESLPLLTLSQLMLRQGDADAALAHAQAALDLARDVQNPESEARALWCAGQAALALGRADAAAAWFANARAVAVAADVPSRWDADAGLAQVALDAGDVGAARRTLEDLLAHVAGGGTLVGTDASSLIRWRGYQVLERAGDPRAAAWLADAHAALQAQVAALGTSPLRESFLNRIAEHREIVAAWERSRA